MPFPGSSSPTPHGPPHQLQRASLKVQTPPRGLSTVPSPPHIAPLTVTGEQGLCPLWRPLEDVAGSLVQLEGGAGGAGGEGKPAPARLSSKLQTALGRAHLDGGDALSQRPKGHPGAGRGWPLLRPVSTRLPCKPAV